MAEEKVRAAREAEEEKVRAAREAEEEKVRAARETEEQEERFRAYEQEVKEDERLNPEEYRRFHELEYWHEELSRRAAESWYWHEELLPMRRNPPTLEHILEVMPEFDPSYPEGSWNQSGGAPWGVHPFYDYGPMPGHVGWDLLRERTLCEGPHAGACLRTVGRVSLFLRSWHNEAMARVYAPHGPHFENAKAAWAANCEEQKRQKLA